MRTHSTPLPSFAVRRARPRGRVQRRRQHHRLRRHRPPRRRSTVHRRRRLHRRHHRATTTTVALDTLPDCPTDALARPTGTVEIAFWHGMSGPLGEEITRLTDAYNASQDKVKVKLVQGSYEETADNYFRRQPDDRPDIVQLPEYQVQAMIDTASTVPVGKCIEASGFDTSAFLPTALAAYATSGVQWAMPFNISNPVLFYNKRVVRRGRSRSRHAAGVARRAARRSASRSSTRAPRSTASPSSRASTRAAAGTSSSGSQGAGVLRRRRQRSHQPRHQGAVQQPDRRRPAHVPARHAQRRPRRRRRRQQPERLRQPAEVGRPAGARGDDHQHVGVARPGAAGARHRPVPATSTPTTWVSARCPAPTASPARSSAALRCGWSTPVTTCAPRRRGTSSRTSSAPQQQSEWAAATGLRARTAPMRSSSSRTRPRWPPTRGSRWPTSSCSTRPTCPRRPVRWSARSARCAPCSPTRVAAIFDGADVKTTLDRRRQPGQQPDHRLQRPQLTPRPATPVTTASGRASVPHRLPGAIRLGTRDESRPGQRGKHGGRPRSEHVADVARPPRQESLVNCRQVKWTMT